MDCETVNECNLELLKSGKYCDVIFIVGEAQKRIPGHTFLLKIRSPVFEVMFTDRWNTDSEKIHEISIPDVEPSVFRRFLEFVYADKWSFLSNPFSGYGQIDDTIKILYLADKYQVSPLIRRCQTLMKTELKVRYAVKVFGAARQFNLTSLEEEAGDFIAKRFSKLIHHPNFLTADEEMLLQFLPRNDLLVHEFELFEALLEWSKKQLEASNSTSSPAEQRGVLQNILPLVRFPLMNERTFAAKVVPTNILTVEESQAIQTYLTQSLRNRPCYTHILEFPWQPRCSMGKEYKVDLYVAHNSKKRVKLSTKKMINCVDHTEVYRFSISCKSDSSQSFEKTGFLTSLNLCGPKYTSVTGCCPSWPKNWIVSLKFVQRQMNSWTPRDPCCMGSERTIEGKQLFSSKQTTLAIDPPIVLQKGYYCRVYVSYTTPVYLPNLHFRQNTLIQDHLTSKRLKTWSSFSGSSTDDSLESAPELGLRVKAFGSNSNLALTAERNISHCIRSVKVLLCDF